MLLQWPGATGRGASAARAVCRRHRSARRCAPAIQAMQPVGRKRGGVGHRAPAASVQRRAVRCIEAGQQRRRQQCRQVAASRPTAASSRASGQPACAPAGIALVGVRPAIALHAPPRARRRRADWRRARPRSTSAHPGRKRRGPGLPREQHQTLTRAHLVHQQAQQRREGRVVVPGLHVVEHGDGPRRAAHRTERRAQRRICSAGHARCSRVKASHRRIGACRRLRVTQRLGRWPGEGGRVTVALVQSATTTTQQRVRRPRRCQRGLPQPAAAPIQTARQPAPARSRSSSANRAGGRGADERRAAAGAHRGRRRGAMASFRRRSAA